MVAEYAGVSDSESIEITVKDPNVLEGETFYFFDSSATNTPSATNVNWNPNWGQAGTLVVSDEDITAGGKTGKFLVMSNLNYQGIEFDAIDATLYDEIHVSYYTEDGTALSLYPVDKKSGEYKIALDSVETGKWVHAVFTFDSAKTRTQVFQFKFEGSGNYYLDNLFFFVDSKNTLSNAKTILTNTIASAEAISNDAVEGTEEGQYEVGSIVVLNSAIETAKAVLNGTSTNFADFTDASKTLETAIEDFNDKMVKFSLAWYDVTFSFDDFGDMSSVTQFAIFNNKGGAGKIYITDVAFVNENTKTYLYKSEGDADLTLDMSSNWDTGTTYSEGTAEGIGNYRVLTSGSGWGTCTTFAGITAGALADYGSLSFRICMTDFKKDGDEEGGNTITVQFTGAATPENSVVVTTGTPVVLE